MAKNRIIEQEVISVSPEVMRELRTAFTGADGKPLSKVSIYNALKYATHSDTAKEIRREAIRRGGRKITKLKVRFL